MQNRSTATFDIVVVGAGFAGLYALHLLRRQGWRVHVVERAGSVGGTWYWNRYPGARCDVQSLAYSYSFDDDIRQKWRWSERYATQPEILKYLEFVAHELDLRKDITFDRQVIEARFDESSNSWSVTDGHGDRWDARYLVMATGALSKGRLPEIPGMEQFAGAVYHTGSWPHDPVDFTGKRVGVIGTGSSGVQAIPRIAAQAKHATVFQRTPAYVAPARNGPITEAERLKFDAGFQKYRALLKSGEIIGSGDLMLVDHLPPKKPYTFSVSATQRQELMEARWQTGGFSVAHAFADALSGGAANEVLAEFFRMKIREIVRNPATAAILCPTDYPVGSKRLCIGTDYFETFNRENVTLINLRTSPIEAITATSLRTADANVALDAIVFATGFDALTGALTAIDIRGVGGALLCDVWAGGPKVYLGLAVFGFPNLFTVTGPGSPSVLANMVTSIEQHVEWIADLLSFARAHGFDRIEAEPEAQQSWANHAAELAAVSIFAKGKSWYVGANIPGKARVILPYIGGIGPYRAICEEVAQAGYHGLRLTRTAGVRTE